jgi:predicted enzyme related to lactoylglutathione lyase
MDERCMKVGTFTWCELMTPDAETAKSFYTRLFGWETEDVPMPDMTYTIIKADGKGIGGILAMQGMQPAWGAYVSVEDVDAKAREVETLGGKVLLEPRDIPNVGRFCVIQDPQGAVLNLIAYL